MYFSFIDLIPCVSLSLLRHKYENGASLANDLLGVMHIKDKKGREQRKVWRDRCVPDTSQWILMGEDWVGRALGCIAVLRMSLSGLWRILEQLGLSIRGVWV